MPNWLQYEMGPDGKLRQKRIPSSAIYGPHPSGGALMNTAQAAEGPPQPPPLLRPQGQQPMYMGPRPELDQTVGGALQSVMSPQGQPRSAPTPNAATPPQAVTNGTGPEGSAAAPNLPPPPKEEVDQMVQRAKRAPEDAKKEIAKSGFDFNAAFDQWVEKFGGLQDPKAKLTKEEKGLFLMEFGMRMMANAQTMSAAGAAGAAGVPVLQQLRGREAQINQQNAGVLGNAMKGVEAESMMRRAQSQDELARAQIDIEKQKLNRLTDRDVVWTDKGAAILNSDGTLKYLKGKDGQPVLPGTTPGAGSKQYAQQWLYEMLVNKGNMSPQEAIQVTAGAMTPMEVQQRAGDLANKELNRLIEGGELRAVPPGGKERKNISKWTKAERDAYRDQLVQQYIETMKPLSQGGTALGGGMPGGAGAGALQPGTVEDGFEFLGGDPADPASWRQQ